MGPVQISYPSVEFKNQLRDGVAPIEACAFNAPRREFIAVDASALRVWGLKRVMKTIMAPSKVRYSSDSTSRTYELGTGPRNCCSSKENGVVFMEHGIRAGFGRPSHSDVTFSQWMWPPTAPITITNRLRHVVPNYSL